MKLILMYVLIMYLALMSVGYFMSDSMLFIPPKPSYKDIAGSPEFIKLTASDGETIFAYYKHNKNAKYTMFVSHGNAQDIGIMLPFLQEMYDHGYSIFAYDYHGYGLSGGKPGEYSAYIAAEAAYDYLVENLYVSPSNIIAYGHSLGAAISLDLATYKPVGALILEGAFVTAFRAVTQVTLLPFDKFDNIKKIPSLKSPLLVIHGVYDSVVPFWHGKMLYNTASVAKQFYSIKNAGHSNLSNIAGEEYWDTISDFIHKNLVKKTGNTK